MPCCVKMLQFFSPSQDLVPGYACIPGVASTYSNLRSKPEESVVSYSDVGVHGNISVPRSSVRTLKNSSSLVVSTPKN